MASSPYFINNFTHIWDQFLFRQYETWVTVGSYFHFFKIFVAIRKHLLDLAMVGIPNNGWDTAAIILFLNNIFIPFFDAIEYLMDLAPIDDSGSALNGLAPFLEITDGQPHIMYFFALLVIVTRYLARLKAVASLKLYCWARLRTSIAYIIYVFGLLLDHREIELLILCLIWASIWFLLFQGCFLLNMHMIFYLFVLSQYTFYIFILIGITIRLIQAFTLAARYRVGFGVLVRVQAAVAWWHFLSNWEKNTIIILNAFRI